MKHSIVYLLLSFFLFVSCGENDPFVPENVYENQNENEDEDNQENLEDVEKAPTELLFTEENTEAKNKLVGLWNMIYDGWRIQPGKDVDDFDGLYKVEFFSNGIYRKYYNSSDEYEERAYQISDQYFYFHFIPEEGDGIEEKEGELTTAGGHWIYSYRFYDDKFRVDCVWGMIAGTGGAYLFKRVEQ